MGQPAELRPGRQRTRRIAADLRQGARHAEFTTAELSFAELPGAPEKLTDATWALVNAAKAVSGRWTAYTGDAGGGTRVAFLIEHPDFQLPPPNGPRVMRVLQEGLMGAVRISDFRLAVRGYAAGRGFDADWSEHSVALSGPGVRLLIEFDELGRIGRIDGTMHAS